MTYKTSSGEIRRADGKIKVHLRIGRLKITTTMLLVPYGCSYNILLANDVVSPLDGDILRSEKLVRPHWGNEIVCIPLLREPSDEEVRGNESYFLTTVDSSESENICWLDGEPPEFVFYDDPKNGAAHIVLL